MTPVKIDQPRLFWNRLRFLPYGVLGILIFSVNSTWDFNGFFRGYFTVIEVQTAILLLYFMIARFSKLQKNKTDL